MYDSFVSWMKRMTPFPSIAVPPIAIIVAQGVRIAVVVTTG